MDNSKDVALKILGAHYQRWIIHLLAESQQLVEIKTETPEMQSFQGFLSTQNYSDGPDGDGAGAEVNSGGQDRPQEFTR